MKLLSFIRRNCKAVSDRYWQEEEKKKSVKKIRLKDKPATVKDIVVWSDIWSDTDGKCF